MRGFRKNVIQRLSFIRRGSLGQGRRHFSSDKLPDLKDAPTFDKTTLAAMGAAALFVVGATRDYLNNRELNNPVARKGSFTKDEMGNKSIKMVDYHESANTANTSSGDSSTAGTDDDDDGPMDLSNFKKTASGQGYTQPLNHQRSEAQSTMTSDISSPSSALCCGGNTSVLVDTTSTPSSSDSDAKRNNSQMDGEFMSFGEMHAEATRDRDDLAALPNDTHRIVICGGGVMGGALAWQLAKRIAEGGAMSSSIASKNVDIVVLDGGFPNSSWGESRIARLSYPEDTMMSLAKRALHLYEELQAAQNSLEPNTGMTDDPKYSGHQKRTLYYKVPTIDLGDVSDEEVRRSMMNQLQTYDKNGIPYEVCSFDNGIFQWGSSVLGSTPENSDNSIRLLPQFVRSTTDETKKAPIQLREGKDVAILQPDGAAVLATEVTASLREVFEGYDGSILSVVPDTGETRKLKCKWLDERIVYDINRSTKSLRTHEPDFSFIQEDVLPKRCKSEGLVKSVAANCEGGSEDSSYSNIVPNDDENKMKRIVYSQLCLTAGARTNKLLKTAELPLLPLIATNEQILYYEPQDNNSNDPKQNQYLASAGFPVMIEHSRRGNNSVVARRYNSKVDEQIASIEEAKKDAAAAGAGGEGAADQTAMLASIMREEIDYLNSTKIPVQADSAGTGISGGVSIDTKSAGVYVVPQIPDGFPAVKIGAHRQGQLLVNDEEFIVRPQDLQKYRHRIPNADARTSERRMDDLNELVEFQTNEFVTQYLPGLKLPAGPTLHFQRCLYTQTFLKDEDFIVGKFQDQFGDISFAEDGIFVATGFGGEGFKFAPAIGEFLSHEVLADLVKDKKVPLKVDGLLAPELVDKVREKFSTRRCFVQE